MKKSLLLSFILLTVVILLTACEKKDEENSISSKDNNTISVNSTDTKSDEIVIKEKNIVEVDTCENTIQKYLDGADKKGSGVEVKKGDNIVVDYIGRLEDGTVFDTSIQSIAEACGKYNEARNYNEGLSFEAQGGQMVKGFDNGVIGMKVGQTKTVQFGPEEGYGEYDENLVVTAPIDEVGDVSQLKEGDTVYLGMGYPAKIVKITDKEITFDMNNELAGKNLIFDITLKSIN